MNGKAEMLERILRGVLHGIIIGPCPTAEQWASIQHAARKTEAALDLLGAVSQPEEKSHGTTH